MPRRVGCFGDDGDDEWMLFVYILDLRVPNVFCNAEMPHMSDVYRSSVSYAVSQSYVSLSPSMGAMYVCGLSMDC